MLPAEGLYPYLRALEKSFIVEALRLTKNNKQQAAKLLKIRRSNLLMKMKRHGLAHLFSTPTRKPPVQLNAELESTGAPATLQDPTHPHIYGGEKSKKVHT